ncbi:MAG: HAMP domain-containing sensor histidine kinase [Cyclobacteriaceae bacterium]
MNLKPEIFYLKHVVSEIGPIYSGLAEKKGIDLTCLHPNELTVYGDKNQIEFIIRNLLNNAIKFTDRGGFVKLEACDVANGEILIIVSDNGVGISDEAKKRIFVAGKNKSEVGTEGEKGTGLGLTLTYEFIKLNRGEIKVESQVGKGTTFYVRLAKGN